MASVTLCLIVIMLGLCCKPEATMSFADNLDSLFFDQGPAKASFREPNTQKLTGFSPRPIVAPPEENDLMLSQAFRTPFKPLPLQPTKAPNPAHVADSRPKSVAKSLDFSQFFELSQTQEAPTKGSDTSKNEDKNVDKAVVGQRSQWKTGSPKIGSPKVGVVAPSQLVSSQRVSTFRPPAKKPDDSNTRSQKRRAFLGPMEVFLTHALNSQPPKQAEHRTLAKITDITSQNKPVDAQLSQEDLFKTQGVLNDRQSPSRQQISHGFTYTPAGRLQVPEMTPGGTTSGFAKLKSTDEVQPYRDVFPFPYFNFVQSKVFDDVFYTDKPIVLCAPTGSGKTVVFELAIIRLLLSQHGNITSMAKVVYMAPIKALCSEKSDDWKAKFGHLGLKCYELTGDSELDSFFELQDIHIILTTPEKWDSMTRRWRENKSLVKTVRLFLIDEVHTLNDSSRGATMEAVVSRMKTVHQTLTRETTGKTIRFVAVSATVPNVDDVGEWLSSDTNEACTYNIDESHRPVRLRRVVLGYPASDTLSEFRFDLSLNYKLASIIETYSDQKPTLVFCATRKGTSQAAGILVKDARFIMNAQHKQRLQKAANMLHDAKLREVVMSGVAYHHAGLDLDDRKLIETTFGQGDLPVLLSTSTLAMGVNLPAHLVVIKSTQHYVGGAYQEYAETQILQMIGRAGRPQFDTSATAVVMTRTQTKSRYECLLNGTQMIESSLHQNLVEHLNAEIVLRTISDVSIALEWAKSTFLYIRLLKNPTHYGMPQLLSKERVEQKLQELCLCNLNSLAFYNLVKMDADCFVLNATETGQLMARYCIAFDTMKNFNKITGTEGLSEMLDIFCGSREFSDILLRVNEKKTLNTLNKDKNRVTIRFPMTGKIKTREMKVNCLIQAQLSSLSIQDFSLQQDVNKINRASLRIVRCLVEVLWQRTTGFKALLNAVLLSKCIKARLWENSKHVTRQLTGIGVTLANALVNAGVTTFQKVLDMHPREIEMHVSRHPPFGQQVQNAVAQLPKYQLSVEQSDVYSGQVAVIVIKIDLSNAVTLEKHSTAGSHHMSCLLVGDANNNIILKVRVSDSVLLKSSPWTRKVEVKRAQKGEELSINFISQDWVGLDVQSTFTPFYSGPKRLGWDSCSHDNKQIAVRKPEKTPLQMTSGNPSKRPSQQAPVNTTPAQATFDLVDDSFNDFFEESRKPCNHKCINKDTCRHECCKFGITAKEPKLSMMDKLREQMKNRLKDTPQIPNPKRLKTVGPLDQYLYKPQPRPVLSRQEPAADSLNRPPGGSNSSGSGGAWDAQVLFNKRRQATKEWILPQLYDPSEEIPDDVYDEEVEEFDFEQEAQVGLKQSFQAPPQYESDVVIEDFQFSPELLPKHHRRVTRPVTEIRSKPDPYNSYHDEYLDENNHRENESFSRSYPQQAESLNQRRYPPQKVVPSQSKPPQEEFSKESLPAPISFSKPSYPSRDSLPWNAGRNLDMNRAVKGNPGAGRGYPGRTMGATCTATRSNIDSKESNMADTCSERYSQDGGMKILNRDESAVTRDRGTGPSYPGRTIGTSCTVTRSNIDSRESNMGDTCSEMYPLDGQGGMKIPNRDEAAVTGNRGAGRGYPGRTIGASCTATRSSIDSRGSNMGDTCSEMYSQDGQGMKIPNRDEPSSMKRSWDSYNKTGLYTDQDGGYSHHSSHSKQNNEEDAFSDDSPMDLDDVYSGEYQLRKSQSSEMDHNVYSQTNDFPVVKSTNFGNKKGATEISNRTRETVIRNEGKPRDMERIPIRNEGNPSDMEGIPNKNGGNPSNENGIPNRNWEYPSEMGGIPHGNPGITDETTGSTNINHCPPEVNKPESNMTRARENQNPNNRMEIPKEIPTRTRLLTNPTDQLNSTREGTFSSRKSDTKGITPQIQSTPVNRREVGKSALFSSTDLHPALAFLHLRSKNFPDKLPIPLGTNKSTILKDKKDELSGNTGNVSSEKMVVSDQCKEGITSKNQPGANCKAQNDTFGSYSRSSKESNRYDNLSAEKTPSNYRSHHTSNDLRIKNNKKKDTSIGRLVEKVHPDDVSDVSDIEMMPIEKVNLNQFYDSDVELLPNEEMECSRVTARTVGKNSCQKPDNLDDSDDSDDFLANIPESCFKDYNPQKAISSNGQGTNVPMPLNSEPSKTREAHTSLSQDINHRQQQALNVEKMHTNSSQSSVMTNDSNTDNIMTTPQRAPVAKCYHNATSKSSWPESSMICSPIDLTSPTDESMEYSPYGIKTSQNNTLTGTKALSSSQNNACKAPNHITDVHSSHKPSTSGELAQNNIRAVFDKHGAICESKKPMAWVSNKMDPMGLFNTTCSMHEEKQSDKNESLNESSAISTIKAIPLSASWSSSISQRDGDKPQAVVDKKKTVTEKSAVLKPTSSKFGIEFPRPKRASFMFFSNKDEKEEVEDYDDIFAGIF